ncbi:hypothetical protein GQ457_06G014040 [Hibiscus cannabinus]
MKDVIIVCLLRRNIGYGTLLNRLHALWRPKGETQLIDLENNYYLVWFEDMRDYEMVPTDGPWTIFGSYLTVQPWSRSFSMEEKHPSHAVVWVRLPGLPYRYYYKALFSRIAQVIGRVIKIDYNTQAGERDQEFARILDHSKEEQAQRRSKGIVIRDQIFSQLPVEITSTHHVGFDSFFCLELWWHSCLS